MTVRRVASLPVRGGEPVPGKPPATRKSGVAGPGPAPVQRRVVSLPVRGDKRRLHVGLLGGSFNPAHAGHLQVARLALARLRLDQVWLLVSPGNPLKPRAGMAPLAARLESARALSDGRRIIATDIERHLRTRYTIDTLLRLRRLFPNVRFVWLMGADGLAELPRWRRWRDIVRAVPIAVLPRPGYNHRALAGQAARRLVHARRPGGAAPVLANSPAPAWMFLTAPQTDISATALRLAAADGSGRATADESRLAADDKSRVAPANKSRLAADDKSGLAVTNA